MQAVNEQRNERLFFSETKYKNKYHSLASTIPTLYTETKKIYNYNNFLVKLIKNLPLRKQSIIFPIRISAWQIHYCMVARRA